MKNIAIYGIGGLYNFGCEAILRGTVEYIRNIYGDSVNIVYYSRNIREDSKVAKSMGIGVVDIGRKTSFFKKIISKIIDILEIPIVPFFKDEFEKIIKNSDVIVSVGGDIYTIPNYLREKKRYRYVNYLVEFGEKSLKKGKTIIIYGASIGPFGYYEKALNYYINHLKKVDQIICREMESVEYLKREGVIDNVMFLPDPAFLVEHSNWKRNLKYLGINLSELSFIETYGKVSEGKLVSICNLLNELSRITELPLMLIPHVLSPYTPADNDFIFLKKIYDRLAENVKTNTALVKPGSFIDAKQYLRQCKFVISARMHCAVNAVIEGVPSIFLSYSQKAKGMSYFIYGEDWLCVSMQQMDTKLIPTVKKLIEKYDEVNHHLERRNLEIQNIYKDYFQIYK